MKTETKSSECSPPRLTPKEKKSLRKVANLMPDSMRIPMLQSVDCEIPKYIKSDEVLTEEEANKIVERRYMLPKKSSAEVQNLNDKTIVRIKDVVVIRDINTERSYQIWITFKARFNAEKNIYWDLCNYLYFEQNYILL